MWAAAGVTFVSAVAFILLFRSRGILAKKVGALEAQCDEADGVIRGLLEEIEALSMGDHGLSHDDMLDVLLPSRMQDPPDATG